MSKVDLARFNDVLMSANDSLNAMREIRRKEEARIEKTDDVDERIRLARDVSFTLKDANRNKLEISFDENGLKIDSDWRFRITHPADLDLLIEYFKFCKVVLE